MTSTTGSPQVAATLGERVRAARHELGLSQSQLAGTELTKGFISQLESGLARPSIRSLQTIAQRLGKSLDYFLGDEPLAATKRLTFHRLAAEAAVARREWDAVREQASQALTQSPTPAEHAVLLRLQATADLAMGDREVAFERVREALAEIDVASEPLEYAQLLNVRGTAYTQIGQLVAAVEALEAARDVLEKHEVSDPRVRSQVLVNLGTAYRRLGRTSKALTTYQSALSTASRSDELRLAAQGYMGVAVSLYDSGELDGAITNYRRALDLVERTEETDFELSLLQSLAAVHIEGGDLIAGRELAERCRARANAVGNKRMTAIAETELARIALGSGDCAEALRLADGAERVLDAARDNRQRADALRVVGAARAVLHDDTGADVAYRTAIELVRAVGRQPDVATYAAEYAQVLRARGRFDEAFAYLELAQGSGARR